jgi:RES domain
MAFDPAILASLTRRFVPTAYLRCTPLSHRATPLGMGYGKTRFASPNDSFRLLYIAEDLATGVAETIVRDRFEGAAIRELDITDVRPWGVCEVDALAPLRVLDLRGDGCFKLGVSTDIVGARRRI